MVKVELWVPGLKSNQMVEIAHGEVVEGSRGKRHRLYGTYTDPETNKIHKANSFVSKAKFDKAMGELTRGMPVADMTIEKVEILDDSSDRMSELETEARTEDMPWSTSPRWALFAPRLALIC